MSLVSPLRTFTVILAVSAAFAGCSIFGPEPNEDIDTTPPSPVSNLSAAVSNREVTLTWSDPATADLDHIRVTWSPGGMAGQTIAAGTEAFTATALTNGTDYRFVVVAVDAAGNVSAGTDAFATPVGPPDTTAPGPVTSLSATAGDAEVQLTWSDPSDNDLDHVEVTWTPGGSVSQVVPAGDGAYQAAGLTNGVEHTFSVVAVDTAGNASSPETLKATPIDSTPPGQVSNIATYVDEGSVTLTWTDPADSDLDSLEVTWTPAGTAAQTVVPGAETYQATGLSAGVGYTFTIRTVDGNGNVSTGATVSATPPPAVVHVTPSGSGSGSSWAEAMGDPQDAIEYAATFAQNRPEVWIAAGTYYPDSWPNGGTDPRERHFSLRSGVEVYGGFAGTETLRSARDVDANPTILSGDFNNDDVVTGAGSSLSISSGGENAYHVFDHPVGIDETALIDGIIIEGGFADGSDPHDTGGGMRNDGSNPTVSGVEFRHNYAYRNGGGLAVIDAAMVIEDSTFTENYTYKNGGGVYVVGHYTLRSTITRSTFIGNRAHGTYGGGGVGARNGSLDITYSVFSGNDGGKYGGGVYAGGRGIVANSVFLNNEASSRGGGFYGANGQVSVYNSVFVGNHAQLGGGLAYWQGSAAAEVVNATVVGNTAAAGGGIGFDSSETSIYNSILWGNSAYLATAGDELHGDETYPADSTDPPSANDVTVANTIIAGYPSTTLTESGGALRGTFTAIGNSDPAFVDQAAPAGVDGEWLTADDGLVPQAGSPAIDAALTSNLPVDELDLDGDGDSAEPLPIDALLAPRVQGGEVDQGAYEQ